MLRGRATFMVLRRRCSNSKRSQSFPLDLERRTVKTDEYLCNYIPRATEQIPLLFPHLYDFALARVKFQQQSSKSTGPGERQPWRPGPGAALSPAASGGREAAAGPSARRAPAPEGPSARPATPAAPTLRWGPLPW